MELLIAHWHCILPAAAIIIAMIFMNKDENGNKRYSASKRQAIISDEENEL